MATSIIIGAAACLLMICGVLFFPQIRLGKIKLDSYWVIVLLGALVMLLSVFTVGVSAYEFTEYVFIYTSLLGAEVGDYLYFPVYYDDDSYFYGEEDTKIKITFPFTYDP